ncbi:hypothetical protein A3850_008195 [Lewinella sp. 4G2]|nr:hypothetical protein A3850_008195 [Lewinella sp. 4G2]
MFLASVALDAQNQSFSGYIEAGDRAMQKDDHYNAYRLYSIAAEDEWDGSAGRKDRLSEVYYKAGVAAYKTAAYEQGQMFLMKFDSTSNKGDYPLAKYYLGANQFRQGFYDQAVASFQTFLDMQPSADAKMRMDATKKIKDSNWAIDQLAKAEDMQIRHLGTDVNSDDSDVAYTRGPNNTVYFSSNKMEWDGDSLTPNRTISKIFKQTGTAGIQPLAEGINVADKNVAHTAFTKDMKMVYYSVCDFRDYDQLRCDLYKANVGTDGSWTNGSMLKINQAGYYTGQPNVGVDKNTGDSYLFFSSDRPGGVGGRDLYRASLSADGTVGTPENLRDINTEDDDVTPFWHEGRNTLFFATDGRFTFGGLDIYRASLSGTSWREPVNLGSPINSAADDAYYVQYDETEQAYMASRRQTGEAIYYEDAKEVCCYDIYEFTPPTGIELKVLTFNDLTKEELEGVTVALYEMTPGGPVLVEEMTNLTGNGFDFIVEPGGKYQLKATKDGFTTAMDEFDLNSPELVDETSIERMMYLAPAVKLDVFTFNNVDEQPLPGSTIKLYEMADNGALTLIDEVTNTGGNDSHFELEIGKRYKVEGMKAGFGEASTEVDLRDYDANSGSTTIRRDLYLGQQLEIRVIDGITKEPLSNAAIRLVKRSGKLVGEDVNPNGNDFYYTVNLDEPFYLNTTRDGYFPRRDTLTFTQQDLIDGGGKLVFIVPLFPDDPAKFLPFEVYFDNDFPDPDAYSSRTRRNYEQTYYPYLDRQPVFREKASEGMDNQQAFLTRNKIDQFFDTEVRAGWTELTNFSDALIAYLERGNTFNLELAGFASPRAPTEYNRRLSARRNMSLEKFFRAYRGGVLGGYLDSKQLTLSETAFGETTAKLEKIYERIDRERESIYSTEASLERRVELRKPLSTSKK